MYTADQYVNKTQIYVDGNRVTLETPGFNESGQGAEQDAKNYIDYLESGGDGSGVGNA